MKKLILISAAFCGFNSVQAQTAPDFTATDCSGVSHTLYTELNAGKVIVLTWVMPCGMCIGGGNAADDAVASFSTSNPGEVIYWLADDLGDATCATLTTWANNNTISKATLFSNAGNVIDENDFSGTGMPHVVVISPDKTILYNKKNGAADDQAGITAAISQGLSALSVATIDAKEFAVTPNPASSEIRISYSKAVQSIIVMASNGQTVLETQYPAGQMNPVINVATLASGIYKVMITDASGKRGTQQIIKQ